MPFKKKQFVKVKTIPSDKEIKQSQDKYLALEMSRRAIFFNNLLGGIAWGLGATVGASIVVALLGFLLTQLYFIPIIGYFAGEVSKFIPKR